jgi:hypothetical protein
MITFASLVLGLTLGTHPIALSISGPVAAIELVLDGVRVARIERPPWIAKVDFGARLLPHELLARSLDVNGREIAQSRQWINLPRPPAETAIVIERDAKGKPTAARLVWESLTGLAPLHVRATFDGTSVPVIDDRIKLPLNKYESSHVLSIEVEFSAAIRSRTDIVLGGGLSSESKSELTGIAVAVKGGRGLAELSAMQDLFFENEHPLHLAAVEKAPIDVLIVRDLGVADTQMRLAVGGKDRSPRSSGLPDGLSSVTAGDKPPYEKLRLGREDQARFIWPASQRYPGRTFAADLFAHSREFPISGIGLYSLLTRIEYPTGDLREERLADAVAVAGLEAVGSGRRRAVLLLLSADTVDTSLFSPSVVRDYLEALHVPLFVWSLGELRTIPSAAAWGPAEDVSTREGFEKAVARLGTALESQRIAWLEGTYLPQAVTLSEKAPIQFAK